MEAKELRIGNWVEDLFNKRNPEKTQVDLDLFQAINNFIRSGQPYPLKPIPLTEEWLEKFGFQYDYEGNLFLEPIHDDAEANFYFHWEVDELVLRDSFEDVFMSRLNYVHQLQNLYFALCGEELTIKEQ